MSSIAIVLCSFLGRKKFVQFTSEASEKFCAGLRAKRAKLNKTTIFSGFYAINNFCAVNDFCVALRVKPINLHKISLSIDSNFCVVWVFAKLHKRRFLFNFVSTSESNQYFSGFCIAAQKHISLIWSYFQDFCVKKPKNRPVRSRIAVYFDV